MPRDDPARREPANSISSSAPLAPAEFHIVRSTLAVALGVALKEANSFDRTLTLFLRVDGAVALIARRVEREEQQIAQTMIAMPARNAIPPITPPIIPPIKSRIGTPSLASEESIGVVLNHANDSNKVLSDPQLKSRLTH
jgi:hypothetical protein